jgi:hypothetical protein
VPIHPGVAPVPRHARSSGTAWALSLLTTLASVVFAVGAIAGWILGLWPATPLTLFVAAAVVVGGPLAAALFLRVRRREAPAPAPALAPAVVVPAPRPLIHRPLTPEQAWARELLAWRARPRSRRG